MSIPQYDLKKKILKTEKLYHVDFDVKCKMREWQVESPIFAGTDIAIQDELYDIYRDNHC